MRFIQVGVGGFGAGWVQRLTEEKRAKVVGLVDLSASALEGARAIGNYPESICFDSLEAALAKVQADALVCVTPPQHHRRPVMAALKAGLHVICEKPMALTLADCKAMARAADATKRTLVISQNYRYSPPMHSLAALVRRGVIGDVGQVQISFFKGVDFGGGFRAQMDNPLIVDMAVHHFDLLRFLTGLDAVAVRGEAWNPVWSNYRGDASASVSFELAGGARAIYSGSWCSKGDFCDWNGNWQIEGTKGTLTYNKGVIRLYRAPKVYTVVATEDMPHKPMKRQAQDYVLDEFIRCVSAGRLPATHAGDNLRSAAMVFAAERAIVSGRRIPIVL